MERHFEVLLLLLMLLFVVVCCCLLFVVGGWWCVARRSDNEQRRRLPRQYVFVLRAWVRERVDTEPCVGAGDVLWSAVLLGFCSFPPRHLIVARKRNESVLLTPPRLQRLSASARRLSRRCVCATDACWEVVM